MPPAIQICDPSFELVAETADALDRVGLSPVSKHLAYFANYSDGGRIKADGTVEIIKFDATDFAKDPAVLQVGAVGKNSAWFLRGDLWLFDRGKAERFPTPEGVQVTSLGVAADQVWIGGKEGSQPAIFRLDGDRWNRVPFKVERFENLSLTLARDGTPYLQVTQAVEKPPPPPGTVQNSGLRTKTTVWSWNGTSWHEITPPQHFNAIVPGNRGVVYAIAAGFTVQRFNEGAWTSVPLAPGSFAEKETERDPGRRWGMIMLGSTVDPSGRLWIPGVITMSSPTDSGQWPGLWLLDGDAIRRIPIPKSSRKAGEISGVSVSDDGAIWMSAGDLIYRGRCA